MYMTRNHEANQWAILEAGGVVVIVTAMMSDSSNPEMQQYGCGTLMHLARNHNRTQVVIVAAGGICAIIAAMESQASYPVVQQYGCEALMHLTVNEDFRDRIDCSAGIAYVISAIEAQEPNGVAQHDDCLCLERLLAVPKKVILSWPLSSFLHMNDSSLQSTLSRLIGAALPGYFFVSHFHKLSAFFPCCFPVFLAAKCKFKQKD